MSIFIQGYKYEDVELVQWFGITGSPSISTTSKAKIYFDNTSGKLKASENGGAYADLVGGSMSIGSPLSGGTPNSVLYIDSSGNLAQDNPGFTYVPDTSFVAFGIQIDVSHYSFGDFGGLANGNAFQIENASNQFIFQNNNLDGIINFIATSTGAGASNRFVFSHDVYVPDEVYGVGWDGSLEVPTKNAIYDMVESNNVLTYMDL